MQFGVATWQFGLLFVPSTCVLVPGVLTLKVSAVKSPRRSAAVGTMAPVSGCSGHLTQTGIAEEEEGLVVLDGATDGTAKLVAVVRQFDGRPPSRGPGIGVEVGVAVELEQSAMKFICSRLCDNRDDSGGELAILRPECAGLYAKLFECVGVGRRVSIVAHTGYVVAAIQVKGNFGIAAVNGAVDLDIRGR